MTTNMPLTDAVIEAALARCAERISDDGLQDRIMAGVARTSQSRPPLAARLGWLAWPAPSLRLAWVVAIAGLLLALLGGSLLVGSRPAQELPAVVPPVLPAFVCPTGSTPDKPGPVDQARPPQDSNAAVAFDRRAGRLVAVTSAGEAVETWTFDVCTNTWTRMHPDREPASIDWAQLVYDIDSDATILLSIELREGRGRVWAYDLQADTWTEKENVPINGLQASLAYDPVSGLVVAVGLVDPDGDLWNYNVDIDTWTRIHQAQRGPGTLLARVIAYDASVDRLVRYADAGWGGPPYETWLFDIRAGTWSRSAAERPAVGGWATAPEIVYDEAAAKTVVLLRFPATAYDATADRWEVLAEAEGWWGYPGRMVYDSVNRRLVGLGQTLGMGDAPPGVVEALDLVTGERRVLLQGVGGQAAP